MTIEARAWAEYIEKWHDFFLMAGTAAVTLAGLLFVAISLHVDALVQDHREHLLDLARATLMSFVLVMVLSLSLLVPQAGQRVTGMQLFILGVGFSVWTLRTLIFARGVGHQHFSLGRYRRRLVIPLLGYGYISLVGWMLFHRGSPEWLTFLIGGICLLLGNASGTSWELLVRVARIRRSDAEERAK